VENLSDNDEVADSPGSDSANNNFVIFLYVIRNTTEVDINNFHFGFFFDWDLDGNSFITNRTGYEESRNL